jgi:hypothetical protein
VYPGIFIRKAQQTAYFSIGQIIGDSVYDCDFRKNFGDLDGVVAVDLDERFADRRFNLL